MNVSVRRSARAAMLVFMLATLPNAASSEPAADGSESPLTGMYRFVGGEAEVEAIEGAIEKAVAELNFFIRGAAERRLRKANLPASQMEIVVSGEEATVHSKSRPPITAPLGKPPIEWENPENGKTLRVSYRVLSDRVLEQRLRGDRGLSVLRHTLDEKGATLTVTTTITADMLANPIELKTTYRRDPPPSAP